MSLRMRFAAAGALIGIVFAAVSMAEPTSDAPYAGQQLREIKALSTDDVAGLLSGKGMGFAKAAELNGYPGPMHVLELAEKLGLSADQRARSRDLFESMQTDAKGLGQALVDEECRLDQQFASARITSELLAASLERIGSIRAKLRNVHLQAHLRQAGILTTSQKKRYVELRGYGAVTDHGMRHGH